MVPVLDKNNNPLMPCSEKRARKLMERGEAFSFWKKGVFCLKLTKDPSDRKFQRVIVGIDPGSKREAYTVATRKSVVLNILTNTPDWVKKAVKTRREMRRGRRFRGTPCRKPKWNNLKGKKRLAPSTKARWQAKLRVLNWLATFMPITDVIIEDISAVTKKGQRRWNLPFSPLQVGKQWLYEQIEKRWNLHAVRGYNTKGQRDARGFKKSGSKLKDTWDVHNVDSHCLVEILFGSKINPFKSLLKLVFLRLKRRRLHKLQPGKNGVRRREGSTKSLGLKRGSFVDHVKWGLSYVGGTMKGRISLHSMETGKRLTRSAKVEDCDFLTYSTWSLKTLTPHG
jgi:hypothetical protein